jgi:hypothetical protein
VLPSCGETRSVVAIDLRRRINVIDDRPSGGAAGDSNATVIHGRPDESTRLTSSINDERLLVILAYSLQHHGLSGFVMGKVESAEAIWPTHVRLSPFNEHVHSFVYIGTQEDCGSAIFGGRKIGVAPSLTAACEE